MQDFLVRGIEYQKVLEESHQNHESFVVNPKR
jgi:hypothetical protein